MTNFHRTLRVLIVLGFFFAGVSAVRAQASRTWVSGVGDDVNPCSRTAPCKTFAGAISKTADHGEIDALDPGGFGQVTITKNITIDGGAGLSSVLASGGNAININDAGYIGGPNTITVTLRRLSINGVSNGSVGVNLFSGKVLNIENCQIFGFTTQGVNVSLTADGETVNIKDTTIFQVAQGIRATTTVGSLNLSLDRVRIQNNVGAGITFAAGAAGSVRDSVVDFNQAGGIVVKGNGMFVNIEHSEVNHNSIGLNVVAGATARIGESTFVANGTNFSNAGTIQTFGNNQTDTNPIPGVVTALGLR
jgi:hypothetical protein